MTLIKILSVPRKKLEEKGFRGGGGRKEKGKFYNIFNSFFFDRESSWYVYTHDLFMKTTTTYNR